VLVLYYIEKNLYSISCDDTVVVYISRRVKEWYFVVLYKWCEGWTSWIRLRGEEKQPNTYPQKIAYIAPKMGCDSRTGLGEIRSDGWATEK